MVFFECFKSLPLNLDKLSKIQFKQNQKQMKKLSFFTIFLFSCFIIFAQKPPKSDFVGNFKLDGAPFPKLVVSFENGVLMAEAEGVGKGEIFETSVNDEFKEPNNDAILVFKRTNGIVDMIEIKVQGSVISGKKEGNAMEEFTGTFKFEQGSPVEKVNVVLKEGKLYGSSDQGSAELKPTTEKDKFELVGFDGTAIFKRDSGGKVSGLELNVQGNNLKASK